MSILTPKMAKKFFSDMKAIGEDHASLFKETLIENVMSGKFGQNLVVEDKIMNMPSAEFAESIEVRKTKVMPKKGKSSIGVSYKEFHDQLEYGKKDLGIMGTGYWRLTAAQLFASYKKTLVTYFTDSL